MSAADPIPSSVPRVWPSDAVSRTPALFTVIVQAFPTTPEKSTFYAKAAFATQSEATITKELLSIFRLLTRLPDADTRLR